MPSSWVQTSAWIQSVYSEPLRSWHDLAWHLIGMEYVGSGMHLSRELIQDRVRLPEDLLMQAAMGPDGQLREILQQVAGGAGLSQLPMSQQTHLNEQSKQALSDRDEVGLAPIRVSPCSEDTAWVRYPRREHLQHSIPLVCYTAFRKLSFSWHTNLSQAFIWHQACG